MLEARTCFKDLSGDCSVVTLDQQVTGNYATEYDGKSENMILRSSIVGSVGRLLTYNLCLTGLNPRGLPLEVSGSCVPGQRTGLGTCA